MSNNTLNILHITTHLGGGVGKALSSIVTHEQKFNLKHKHRILLLDDPEKDQFVDVCRKGCIEVLFKGGLCNLEQELSAVDIVVLHWWHHPVMASFLAHFPQIPLRLVLWAHVNGCNYPCLPFSFVILPHKTFFTSPYSLENAHWTTQQQEEIRQRSAVVYGLGKLELCAAIRHKKPTPGKFVIGYVGTLNTSKLHPQFVDFCYAVLEKVPDARFVMVGDIVGSEVILKKATEYNIHDRFVFTGYSTNITDELSSFDIFGYPLNPKHFGTTENALLEAMAFGLPVVALNHNAEKYIIKEHNVVGLLADSIEHYAECIAYLHDNPDERARIGANAREYVGRCFSFDRNVELMRTELDAVARMPQKEFDFASIFGVQPYEWFLSCLGDDRPAFYGSLSSDTTVKPSNVVENAIRGCSQILKEKTKSSVQHFADTFPEDLTLQYWKNILSSPV